jgi:phosphoadenosine phosphosulfate reductase
MVLETFLLNYKLTRTSRIIKKAFGLFPPDKIAIAWTGGKDSTLLLWLIRRYVQSQGAQLPRILFIDEGDTFPEVRAFTKRLASLWEFPYTTVKNSDILRQAKKPGDVVRISKLNLDNRNELKRLGYDQKTFRFEAESFIGNHLMKTVPLNSYIVSRHVQAVITGIRRDENPARANESYFSSRSNPPHTRVHPILHLTESDVWKAIHDRQIPYVSLYRQGYRSLGARSTTRKMADIPAWKQNLAQTKERGGRRQDKEQVMEKLRQLGYM